MRLPLEAGMEVRRVVERPHETRVFLDGVQLRFDIAKQWFTWHPVDDEDVWAFDLDDAQREALVAAIEAVVARDVEAVRALGADDAEDFWTWVEGVELVVPPGSFEDWELNGSRSGEDLQLGLDMWSVEEGETIPLDETLRMDLIRDAAGWRVELLDLHVL